MSGAYAGRKTTGVCLPLIQVQAPEELHDRAVDNWMPLFVIRVGGEWPERARAISLALTEVNNDAHSMVVQLLADIRGVLTRYLASLCLILRRILLAINVHTGFPRATAVSTLSGSRGKRCAIVETRRQLIASCQCSRLASPTYLRPFGRTQTPRPLKISANTSRNAPGLNLRGNS